MPFNKKQAKAVEALPDDHIFHPTLDLPDNRSWGSTISIPPPSPSLDPVPA